MVLIWGSSTESFHGVIDAPTTFTISKPPSPYERRMGSVKRGTYVLGSAVAQDEDPIQIIEPEGRTVEDTQQALDDRPQAYKGKPAAAGGAPPPPPTPDTPSSPGSEALRQLRGDLAMTDTPSSPGSEALRQLREDLAMTDIPSPQSKGTSILESVAGPIGVGIDFLGGVADAGTYYDQMRSGNFEGAQHTAERVAVGAAVVTALKIAKVNPVITLPLIAIGARSEFVNHREQMIGRGETVYDAFEDPLFRGTDIRDPQAAAAAAVYVAGEATVRAVVTPVIDGVKVLGRLGRGIGARLRDR